MAVVKPFKGVRYNPERCVDLQAVVSQPYDRINDELLDRYYELSPYNIAHVIRGRVEEGDDPLCPDGPNVYTRARDYYHQWMDESVLIGEEKPAFYAYEQTFTVDGVDYVRLGMLAAVELTDYDEGIILPHERIHPGPKADRLRLLNTLQVNAEPIFMLYPDPENKVNALMRQVIGDREPDIDVEEILESGVRQRMWAITDEVIIEAIEAEMAPKRNLIIADGHHRYATGLHYRELMREKYPDASADEPYNYISATLLSMNDPGLVIRPAHREICDFSGHTPQEVLERAAEYFDIAPSPDLDTMLGTINADPRGHSYGFYGGPEVGFHVLSFKDSDLALTLIGNGQSAEWKMLTVSVLHEILLEQIAEVPYEGIKDRSMIRYHRYPQVPIDAIDAGKGNFVFFLSPTRIEQVEACAARGEIMPQKSTDFYPKIIAGLALRPINVNGHHKPS
ncbi:MAG: DUF1015 domain-containing protein [Anaerolineae bacterium]|nr:DUF1015 domain-containing protein [Anaerolineae bacterium]